MASICSRCVTNAHKKNKKNKCIYFQRGECLKGSDCPWRHEIVCPNIGKCSNYAKGLCEFSHKLPQCTHHNAPACEPAPALASASQQNLRAIAQAFVPKPAPAPQAHFLSLEEVEQAHEQEEQEEQKSLEDDGSVYAALELSNNINDGFLKLLYELGVPEARIQQVIAEAKEDQAARVHADKEEQELNGTWCGD